MAGIELACKAREVLGKKVASLRKQGITPARVFGHGVDSVAVQCDTAQLQRVLAQAGSTRLVDINIAGEGRPRKALVVETQRDAMKGTLLHVGFLQVSMEEKVRLEIPVALVGQAPGLEEKGAFLAHETSTLNVECLPDAICDRIEVDLSSLTEDEPAIRVKDIKPPPGITILDSPEQVIARIAISRPEEEVRAPAAEAAPAPAEEGAAAPPESTEEK